jgi:Flp pilus assembly protein TadB
MEGMFLQDLASSVEITLPRTSDEQTRRSLVRRPASVATGDSSHEEVQVAREARRRAPRGSRFGRIVNRVSRASIVLTRALLGQRGVGTEDAAWMVAIAVVLLLVATAGFLVPRSLAWPLAFLLAGVGVAALYRALAQRRERH